MAKVPSQRNDLVATGLPEEGDRAIPVNPNSLFTFAVRIMMFVLEVLHTECDISQHLGMIPLTRRFDLVMKCA